MRTKMATTEGSIAPPRSHSTPKHDPKKFGHENEVQNQDRRSLQTLQCSASDDNALVGVGWPHSGKGEKSAEKLRVKQFTPIHGTVRVYRDKTSPHKRTQDAKNRQSFGDQSTQTEDSLLEELIQEHLQQGQKREHASVEKEEDEAFELMVKEPVPETYWKEIAEQRRLALSDTLEENRSLHKEMESLKEENEKLSELASQAEYLSSLLQSVVSDDDSEEEKANDKEAGVQQEDRTTKASAEHDQPQDQAETMQQNEDSSVKTDSKKQTSTDESGMEEKEAGGVGKSTS